MTDRGWIDDFILDKLPYSDKMEYVVETYRSGHNENDSKSFWYL